MRTLPMSLCLMSTFILWGCSSSESELKQQPKTPASATLQTFEKDFRPSRYDPDIAAVESTAQHVRLPKDTATDRVVLQETMSGYRVQILVTNNITEANQLKGDVSLAFPNDIVYVVYEAPYYKVRLGDFKFRAEAARALKALSEKGYSQAWIIPDRVLRFPPKPTRHEQAVHPDSTKGKK